MLVVACPDFDPSHYAFPCTGSGCACSLSQCTAPAQCLDAQRLATYQPLSCAPECRYSQRETGCAHGCSDGGCVGEPCAGVTCESPPANFCFDATTLRAWVRPGTCEAGSCQYAVVDIACAGGCVGGRCVDDLCAGVSCTLAPPPDCDGDVARTYASPGLCDATTGLCAYAQAQTTCAMGCLDGGCLTDVLTETLHTKGLKPNLWLLVDRSGSMATQDACPTDGGPCTTRLAALQDAMSGFLTESGDVARMALTFMPGADGGSDQCTPSHDVAQPLPPPTATDDGTSATLSATAQAIGARIAAVPLGGGTPTGASVAFVGSQPGLNDVTDQRDDFILLLTDGIPNCNPEASNSLCGCAPSTCTPLQLSQCACTVSSCTASASCSTGCADSEGASAQIAAQKAKGIRTIIVAFGPTATSSSASATLTAMAAAGGSSLRACPGGTDAECGTGDVCLLPAHLCRRQYFEAGDAAELGTALRHISANLGLGPASCTLKPQASLDAQRLVAVLVDGVAVAPGPTTWSLSGGAIVFADAGATCQAITAGQQVNITIRYRSP